MVLSGDFASQVNKNSAHVDPVGTGGNAPEDADVHLIPLPRLEWSLVTESETDLAAATAPKCLRRGWIHTAPEARVLELFRRLDESAEKLPAPWWLRPLVRGELSSRTQAHELEDEVHALLASRPGWVFVPWGNAGEIGYWEYGPSDRAPMVAPTTVTLTEQQPGWISVVPAHTDSSAVVTVPAHQLTNLSALLPRIESW